MARHAAATGVCVCRPPLLLCRAYPHKVQQQLVCSALRSCCSTPLRAPRMMLAWWPLSLWMMQPAAAVFPTWSVCWDGSCIVCGLHDGLVLRTLPRHMPWLMHRRVCFAAVVAPLVLPDAPSSAPSTACGGQHAAGADACMVLDPPQCPAGPRSTLYTATCIQAPVVCVCTRVCAAPRCGSFDSS